MIPVLGAWPDGARDSKSNNGQPESRVETPSCAFVKMVIPKDRKRGEQEQEQSISQDKLKRARWPMTAQTLIEGFRGVPRKIEAESEASQIETDLLLVTRGRGGFRITFAELCPSQAEPVGCAGSHDPRSSRFKAVTPDRAEQGSVAVSMAVAGRVFCRCGTSGGGDEGPSVLRTAVARDDGEGWVLWGGWDG
jgi:hypothetical protein